MLVTDLSDYRLDVARRCGLTRTSNASAEPLAEAAKRAFGEEGFDVGFECVGVQATIEAAVPCIRKAGTIIVVGVFGEKPRVDLGLVQNNELTVRGSLMYQRADYERTIELIADGRIVTEPLVSGHFPLEQFAAAYEHIDSASDRTMKVVIDL